MKEKRKNSQPGTLRWTLYVLIIVVALVGIWRSTQKQQASVEPTPSAETYYNRGQRDYRAERYQDAIDNFTQAIDVDNTYFDAYVGRGFAYYMTHNYEQALADYNQAITLNDEDSGVYVLRGRAYRALGRYDDAFADYDRVIELDNDSRAIIWAYNNRCYAYNDLAEYQLALQNCSIAIKLDAPHAYSYNNRCLAYIGLGEYHLALDDCNYSIQLDATNSYAFKNRCLLYLSLEEYDLALDDCNYAIELETDFDLAYAARGLLYNNMGSTFYPEAIADYERYARLNGVFESVMIAQIAEMQDILGDCASGLCYSVRD